MFTFLSRSRRRVAVLTALALLASVLVTVPAVAADDDPKMDYKATFDACVGVGSSDFTDVPAGHTNAGDIDCIAYYGVTKGTSATTYSPLMSVTREQMALFLTRLAGLVGIDMASDPDDAGFTDIGDLSDDSQTAINQLADLEITQGTSATTYSPGDAVRRGHMALFVARLMDKMDPMAEDSDTVFGYTPEDVKPAEDDDDTDVDETKKVESPFTDLKSSTKEAYDAITALWELGVVSGINDTSYAPDISITRAVMAEFMAGVLDHSNARPAGVTIQASETWDFGDFSPTVAVSYRDDSFAPMIDVSVKTFDSDTVGEFDEDGGCEEADECAWTDDESLTDASGNIYEEGTVEDGKMNTYYAWMGDADADENDFDVDTSPHVSVTLSSTTDAVNLKVTTDISKNSTDGNTVDIDSGDDVTLTAQLVDGDGEPVAKAGVEVSLTVMQGANTLHPGPAKMKTDDDGQVTYTTSGPKSTKGATDVDRTDTVEFSADANGDGTVGEADTTDASDPSESVTATIVWTDSNPTLASAVATTNADDVAISRASTGKGEGSTPDYALRNSKNEVTIRATVTFYDQYGNPAGKGNSVLITIADDDDPARRTISSRGIASWRATVVQAALGGEVGVTYTAIQDSDGEDLTGAPTVTATSVLAVENAPDDSSNPAADIDMVYGDEDRFLIDGLLYSYDSDDVFLDTDTTAGNKVVDGVAAFEKLIGANLDEQPTTQANIVVVSYDDGSSIFRVATEAS